MEAQQQQMNIHDQDGNVGSNKPPSFLCRQSSTRWTPTTDQIRILKELYYNNGIRSPSAEQIQRISARLREYGKIEGKNVFYWFQNHKARERQKKRFTTATASNDQVLMNIPAAAPSFHRNNINAVNPGHWRSSHDHQDHSIIYNNTYPSPNFTPPAGVIQSSPNTHGVFAAVGQTGSYGYGSLAMEKSFRECSISPKDNHSSSGGSIPCPYPFLDKFNSTDHDHETLVDEDEEEDDQNMEIETLPLFPMHGEEYRSSSCNNFMRPHDQSSSNGHYYGGWYQSDIGASFGGSARASLELSLNSCITGTRSGDQFY